MQQRIHVTVLVLATAALAGGAPARTLAADAGKEAATAATHANLAANSAMLQDAQMHLHHVGNCLVGPAGDGFDANAGNPCKSLGSGAIADSADAATKKKLTTAAGKAKAGLAAKDLAGAKQAASDVEALLK
jgi:hypothetical protein